MFVNGESNEFTSSLNTYDLKPIKQKGFKITRKIYQRLKNSSYMKVHDMKEKFKASSCINNSTSKIEPLKIYDYTGETISPQKFV